MSTGSTHPGVPASEWANSDDGRDYTAELMYHAEDKKSSSGKPVTRGEIGKILSDFGVTSTGEYVSHFKDVLSKAGHSVA